ncbi:MAG TPA: hypothetical protein VGJ00_08790 [Rhabdochlamydiaceae bacterium]|jgi:hypothetical protein
MKNTKFSSFVSAGLLAVSVIFSSPIWANSKGDKVKECIDNFSDALKKKTDELGDDVRAVQDYLDNYHWKGLIEEQASSGPITLKYLELNGHSRAVWVQPGEKIEAEVICKLDAEKSSVTSLYRVVVGIKGEGPQVVIGHESGLFSGKKIEKFTLRAPEKPGVYQIRFRSVDAYFKSTAFDAWKDEEGNEPDGTTTIGIIVVKPMMSL